MKNLNFCVRLFTCLIILPILHPCLAGDAVKLITDAIDVSAGNVPCYKIETPRAVYFLEKEGVGLSSMIDRDGHDWIGFRNNKGSRAAGEYRDFPNAVHRQDGNFFNPKNSGTDLSTTQIAYAGPDRVTIWGYSGNGNWACRWDFYPTHCTFTTMRMPQGYKYWILYEGISGGRYDDTDWWMTSAVEEKTPQTFSIGFIEHTDHGVISKRLSDIGKQKEAEKLSLDKWQRHFIDDLPQRSMYIKSGDMDGDGDQDLVAGGWWWENPGDPAGQWPVHTIGEPLRNMFAVFDFDADGDPDIVGTQGVGSEANRRFAWARNDGKGSFTVITNIDSCDAGDFLQGAALADFGKGVQLALAWHKFGKGTYLINVPQNPAVNRWTVDMITSTTLKEDISTGDVDRDGDRDMLLGTIWLENENGEWTVHEIGGIADLDEDAEPDRNDLADIDGDGRLDAVVALELGTLVLWFEAPENPKEPWTRHKICDMEGQGFSMDTADFDGDGDPDIVIGEHRGPTHNRVVILENRDHGREWKQIVIDKDAKDVIDHHDGTQAVDLDGDGDLDIVSVGWYNPKVWVFENKAIP